MKRFHLFMFGWVGLITGLCGPASLGAAQAAGDVHLGSAVVERVGPYCDASTVLVARLDLEQVDAASIARLVLDTVPAATDEWSGQVALGQQVASAWIESFRQAGGREIYLVLNLGHLSYQAPMVVVIPIEPGGDAFKLEAALRATQALPNFSYQVMNGSLVTAPAHIMKQLNPANGSPPKDLASAFAAAPQGFLQVVVFPYRGFDRVLLELLPVLPSVLGGEPSAPIAQGFRWAKLGLQLSPQVTVELVDQLASVEAAHALQRIWVNGLNTLGNLPEVQKHLPDWEKLQAALVPQAVENTLRLRLEQGQLVELARQVVLPAAEDARRQATRTAMINNLKHIGLGMIIYANEHNNRFPRHLVDTLPYLSSAQVLTVPGQSIDIPQDLNQRDREAKVAWAEANSPIVYLQSDVPLPQITEPNQVILAYEKPEARNDSMVGVLLADGSVQMLPLEQFRERIREQ